MAHSSNPIRDLSDEQLLRHVQHLATDERRATVRLVAALAELDARRLYLAEGCSSMFTYCTQVLRLSEHAAYGRIEAARAARRYPMILGLFAEGEITLTTITLLAAHLTPDNHRELLEAARGRSRREVERLIATLQPRPALPSSVRKVPEPGRAPAHAMVLTAADGHSLSMTVSGTTEPSPAARDAHTHQPAPPAIAPVAAELYRIHVTVSATTHAKLRRAQDLMRHTVPNGDPAVIFDRALTLLVQILERRKLAGTARPRTHVGGRRRATRRTRYIPAPIRRSVWKRDGGRCAFVGAQGRCTERGRLEFHHVQPYAVGGATTVDNVQLRCRAHNQYEAGQFFGPIERSVPVEALVDKIGP
jgi:hypothetical protein